MLFFVSFSLLSALECWPGEAFCETALTFLILKTKEVPVPRDHLKQSEKNTF